MFSFLHKNLKDRLKEEIKQARVQHEGEAVHEVKENQTKRLSSLKDQIKVFSHMGQFDETSSLLNSLSSSLSVSQNQELKEYTTQEELEYLKQSLQKAFDGDDQNQISKLLSSMQQRMPEELFYVYQQAAELKRLPRYIEILSAQKKIWIKKMLGKVEVSSLPQISKKFISPLKEISKVDSFAETEKFLEKQKQREDIPASLPRENVNEFESIFGATTEDEKDILDIILQSTKPKEEAQDALLSTEKSQNSVDGKFIIDNDEQEEEVIEYINPFLPYLNIVSKVMVASLLFLLFSWSFFYIQLDEKNQVLSFLDQDNLYVQYQKLEEKLDGLRAEKKLMEVRLEKLEQGAADIPAKVAIYEIQSQKIDWLDLREQLHKATLDAFPYNDVLHYIVYTSFQGDAEKGTIAIAGTVTEPSGRVFLLTTKLIQSLNNHSSFSGAEIKTFSKSKNSDEEIGGFTSSFALTLRYNAKTKDFKDESKKINQKT